MERQQMEIRLKKQKLLDEFIQQQKKLLHKLEDPKMNPEEKSKIITVTQANSPGN